jgi:outer membrane protein assembly factor BamA
LGTGPQSAKPIARDSSFEYDDNLYSKPIPDEQMMEFSYIRFHETFMKRIGDTRFFTGLGYHFDYHYDINDHLLNLDTSNGKQAVLTSHYAYSIYSGFNPEKYTISGLSLNILLDSRDNPVNPYHGKYAYASWRLNPEIFGSTQNSSLLWLEFRDYFNLSKTRPRHLIAIWTYASLVTGGKVPYMDLPALGWDQFGKSGRGYIQGRFRGPHLLYGEIEYRVPLPTIIKKNPDMFGAVAFVNATTADNAKATDEVMSQIPDYKRIHMFQYVDPAAGIGLRVMVMKKSKANLTLDYAWGKYGSQGFYFNFNEAF